MQISASAAAGFERGSAHLATQPLRLKDSKRKGASARPGLEPEPCGRERRARARAPELLISSHVQVPVSDANRSARASLRGKQRPRQNGALENGTYQTRAQRQASKLKFTCRAHHAGYRSAHSHMQQQLVRARQRTPCDPAVEDEELGEEGRLRTPEARTRAVRSDGASSARAEGSSNPCGMAVNLAAHAKMQEPSVKEKRAWRRPRS